MEKTKNGIVVNSNYKFDESFYYGDDFSFGYSISSYGADYTVDILVTRISLGDIYIPSFQRRFIWNIEQSSRFIESLLLGLPVPSIFLVKEEDTGKLIVIDGQQRLLTLYYFYEGRLPNGRRFALKGVHPQINGLTYESIAYETRRNLNNSIIHSVVMKKDIKFEDNSFIYDLFLRLNTSGTQLQPQEIRASIYPGEFNELLNELNKNESWRIIYGPEDPRCKDQELILRFLAIFFDLKNYRNPMFLFLNRFMNENRHLTKYSNNQINTIFNETIDLVYKSLGHNAFKPKKHISYSIFDSVMLAIATRLQKGRIYDFKMVREQYRYLLQNESYMHACTTRTSTEYNVRLRTEISTIAFDEVK